MAPTSTTPDINAEIGARIRARRKARNWNQKTLAYCLGVTTQTISKYEDGAIPISASRLIQIAKFLACDPADLLPGTAVETILAAAAARIEERQPGMIAGLLNLDDAQLASVKGVIEAIRNATDRLNSLKAVA